MLFCRFFGVTLLAAIIFRVSLFPLLVMPVAIAVRKTLRKTEETDCGPPNYDATHASLLVGILAAR